MDGGMGVCVWVIVLLLTTMCCLLLRVGKCDAFSPLYMPWVTRVCVAVAHPPQAHAQVDAAKQQLLLLDAEADGARIRGQAESQAAEVSRLWMTGSHVCHVQCRSTLWLQKHMSCWLLRQLVEAGLALCLYAVMQAGWLVAGVYQRSMALCLCAVMQAARNSVAREAAALEEQRAALASLLAQLEQREDALQQVRVCV